MAMISNGLSPAGRKIAEAGLAYQRAHRPLPLIVVKPRPVDIPVEPPLKIRATTEREAIERAHERARREAARIERERQEFQRRTVKVQKILGAGLPPLTFMELSAQPAPSITRPKQIITDALVIFGLTRREFFSKNRNRVLVVARHYATQRIKDECNLSLPRMAREVGYGDHTTAHHALSAKSRARVAEWLAGKGAK